MVNNFGHKLVCFFLTMMLLFQTINVLGATDYSVQTNRLDSLNINELKTLIGNCEDKGISVLYEKVNCAVIERYITNIKSDISNNEAIDNGAISEQNGKIADNAIEYNISYIENLFDETKLTLQNYLSGDEISRNVRLPMMNSLTTEGVSLKSNNAPVISLGYGHFSQTKADIPVFNNFGITNVQMEIGPSVYNSQINALKNALANAEVNNIGVSLLLSPHYFPQNIDGIEYAPDTDTFIKYNVNNINAKEVIREFVEKLIPEISEYNCVTNICLTNEPAFRVTDYPDFYNPIFREYLANKYSTVDSMKTEYGFDEIKIGNNIITNFDEINIRDVSFSSVYGKMNNGRDQLTYDLVSFNEEQFLQWHEWFANLVRSSLRKNNREIPVHSKMMNLFSGVVQPLTYGVNPDNFNDFSDWAGCDSHSYINNNGKTDLYFSNMFFYDYLRTNYKKPIYNSEDHVLNRTVPFDSSYARFIRNNLWTGAIHGMSQSTIWSWERSYDKDSDYFNAVSFRPDCIAKIGQTALDLARLSNYVDKLKNENSKVALLYSKASRYYYRHDREISDTSSEYIIELISVYKKLLEIGINPDVISDGDFSDLDNYDVLIAPNVVQCTDNTYNAVNSFINKGKKVIYTDGAFSQNEYKKARATLNLGNKVIVTPGNNNSASIILSDNLFDYLNNMVNVEIRDETTGERAENIEFKYKIDNGKVLVNLVNLKAVPSETNVSVLDLNNVRNFSVYLDDNKLDYCLNLITDKYEPDGLVCLSGFEPALLECSIADYTITNLRADRINNKLVWDYDGNGYLGAKIYKRNNLGNFAFVGETEDDFYPYLLNDTYYVISKKEEPFFDYKSSFDKMITTGNENTIAISNVQITKADDSCIVKYKTKNSQNTYINAICTVKLFNDTGKMINVFKSRKVFAPKNEAEISIDFPDCAEASKVEIIIVDTEDYSENLAQNQIITIMQ